MGISRRRLASGMRSHQRRVENRYGESEAELLSILVEMERRLVAAYGTLPAIAPGGLTPQNITAMERAMSAYAQAIDSILRVDGADWVDRNALLATTTGIERLQLTLAQAELLRATNVSVLESAFANFAETSAAGVFELGRGTLARGLEGHGVDTLNWLRENYVRGIVEGVPSVGPGSLAERLFDGGRLKDLEIVDRNGVRRVITAETRAQAFARTELNRIETDSMIQQSQAIGIVLYLDAGPLDDRTSDICEQAFEFGGDTPRRLDEWEQSGIGIPPRHPNCRHRLVPWHPDWS